MILPNLTYYYPSRRLCKHNQGMCRLGRNLRQWPGYEMIRPI
ncbi:hypothetical protein SPHINGO391_240012 [Sphingomonas aurantiaca]|uniref:Uncharacterized protein n=1 Tax=Sphingomonas aurantiaca TaxID=185949 RepID=A0A5E7XVF7_9SPHN|nr:hypothetical protein SPHINGO391_240012 [Sphingomonas aurantiaca]